MFDRSSIARAVHPCDRALTRVVALLATLPLSAMAQTDAAQSSPRNWIQVQAYAPSVRSSAPINNFFTAATPDSQVRFEDDLGVPKRKTVATLAIGRRIGENFRIELDYLNIERKGSTPALPRPLTIAGSTFALGSPMQADLRLSQFSVMGGYSLVQTPDRELGFSFGGVITHLSLRLAGTATTGAGRIERSVRDLEPQIGLFGSARVAPQWRLSARAEAGPDGSQKRYTLQAQVQWQPQRHVELGAGWRFAEGRQKNLGLVVSVGEDRADYRMSGPQAFVKALF